DRQSQSRSSRSATLSYPPLRSGKPLRTRTDGGIPSGCNDTPPATARLGSPSVWTPHPGYQDLAQGLRPSDVLPLPHKTTRKDARNPLRKRKPPPSAPLGNSKLA